MDRPRIGAQTEKRQSSNGNKNCNNAFHKVYFHVSILKSKERKAKKKQHRKKGKQAKQNDGGGGDLPA
jgi:hypothetical protein